MALGVEADTRQPWTKKIVTLNENGQSTWRLRIWEQNLKGEIRFAAAGENINS